MLHLPEVLRSGGRWLRLFLLTVLLPAAVVGFMALRAFRGEALKTRYQNQERQHQVLRLVGNDLDGWLVEQRSRGTGGGLVRFRVVAGEVILPDWNIMASTQVVEGAGLRLSEQESRLLLEAQRVEAMTNQAGPAASAYQALLASSARLAPLARLGLLRLAVNEARDEDAVSLVEAIRRQDHAAATESGIPVWVAAGVFLTAHERLDCGTLSGSDTPGRFVEEVVAALEMGAWRLSASRWAFYARELASAVGACAHLTAQSSLQEIAARADWLTMFSACTSQAINLQQLLQSTPGLPLAKGYSPSMRAVIAVLPGEESDVGLVVEESALVALVASRTGLLTQAEDFTGAPLLADSPAWERAEQLPGYPFVRVLFTEKTGKAWDFRANFFVYALVLLLLVTTLGLAFSYRAVAHQVAMTRLRSDFVSTVSHELRTPLTAMQALLERLEAGKVRDPAMLSRYHKVMRVEVQRLAHMVENLLGFARVEGNEERLLREATDLDELVAEVVASFRNLGLGGRIRTLPQPDSVTPLITADRTAIAQCVYNLIDNALKYSPAESAVTVAVLRSGDAAQIAVSDEGPGVPLAERERIFEQFYRGVGSSRGRAGGAGLGLALVKRIVEAHGGRVEVTGQPGTGSTFTLVFPAYRNEGPAKSLSTSVATRAAAKTGVG